MVEKWDEEKLDDKIKETAKKADDSIEELATKIDKKLREAEKEWKI